MVHYINQQIRAGVRRHRRGGGQGETPEKYSAELKLRGIFTACRHNHDNEDKQRQKSLRRSDKEIRRFQKSR